MRSAPSALLADEVHVLRLASGDRDEAGRALRDVLAAYLETSPEAIRIVDGAHGKPELAGRELHFNLSHSGDVGLVAVSRERPVGVDVERIDGRRDVLALAERALGAEGAAAV
ncbi:MAG: 4-phosphopantetheinyl transferase, partial [Actinomycetota bacterium]|nr:4-phosphopantetheinyl transferase [Actinomycetota bacterium]